MIYELSHIIQKKVPFLWDMVEDFNSTLFFIGCKRKLNAIPSILSQHNAEYRFRMATLDDLNALDHFFSTQLESAFDYFKPHSFDIPTLRKLILRKSHLFFIVEDDKKIIGYYFLRCFFVGKCFLGKIVDAGYRGRGIGKQMCLSAMEVANTLGMRMFETISKDNIASMYSTQKVLDMLVIKELDNNYLFVEDFPKNIKVDI